MGWDTIRVDGTDLQQTGVRIFKVWEGVHATNIPRGQNPVFSGVDGESSIDRPFPAQVLGLGLIVKGGAPDVTGFNDAYRTLRRLCPPDRDLALERRLAYAAGNESHTTTARLRSMIPSQLSPADYRVMIEFTILSGLWYGTAVTQAIANGNNTITGVGDVRTKKMTITLTGGTTPTLFNSGYWVHFSGPMTSPVVIDAENGTATQGVTDVSEFLTWKGPTVFQVKAGSHVIALTGGGSASISYTPAFL